MIAPGSSTCRLTPFSTIVTGCVVSRSASVPFSSVSFNSLSTGLSCGWTPRIIPPDTSPAPPESVLETAITCDVTNGATATTPGIAAIFRSSPLGFHTPPSLRSMVTCGVKVSNRPRRFFSNPLITDSASDSANVPNAIPASEMIAISETNRSRRRARKYRRPIRSS